MEGTIEGEWTDVEIEIPLTGALGLDVSFLLSIHARLLLLEASGALGVSLTATAFALELSKGDDDDERPDLVSVCSTLLR